MTLNTDLTKNELHAAFLLVNECLAGMGGTRPADLEDDEYTWVWIDVLVKSGWNRHEAAGTFSSLDKKGFIHENGKEDSFLTTEAWKYLDTIWDEKHAEYVGAYKFQAADEDFGVEAMPVELEAEIDAHKSARNGAVEICRNLFKMNPNVARKDFIVQAIALGVIKATAGTQYNRIKKEAKA